jgi:hypothetical protein
MIVPTVIGELTVSIEKKQQVSPTDRDSEKATSDQLQKQIDALVHGEAPKGSRSLRDLAKKPTEAKENESKGKC